MVRPSVKLENAEALADFYRNHQPKKLITAAGYWAIRSVFHPRIGSDEGAREEIHEILRNPHKRLLIVANHQHWADDAALAAMTTHKYMRPLVGTAAIQAKPPLFNIATPVRYLIDELGAVPIFRRKDGQDPEEILTANKGLGEAYAKRITNGATLATHMQGERRADNLRQIGTLKPGLGHIACAVSKDVELYVAPVAIWYGDNPSWRNRLRPNMYIGSSYEAPCDTPESFTNVAEVKLQNALDHAIAMG